MLDKENSVVVTDPDILGGAFAVFHGTRVPFETLLSRLADGDSVDDFLSSFPTVDRNQVISALEYASESVRLRQTG